MIHELCKEFSQLEQVEAIALGGSRAGQNYDQNSDYDVYVYLNSSIDEATRLKILSKYCSYMEIGNQFWELEDDCVLNNGIQIELIYRSLESFEQELNTTVFQHKAQNAYTTCMWHNLLHSKILYDPNGHYASLQKDLPDSLSTGTQKAYHRKATPFARTSHACLLSPNRKSYQAPRSSQYESSYE